MNKSDSDNKEIVTSVPKFDFETELLSLGTDKEVLADWLAVRKKRRFVI